MSEHTPGPWKMTFEGYPGMSEPEMPDVIADGWPVLVPGPIDGSRPDRTLEQALANARLIAAAPSLLEACKKLLKEYVEADPDNYESWGARDARAAIAKAEGSGS